MICYEYLRVANIALLLFITCSLIAQCRDHRTPKMLRIFYVAVSIVLVISAYSTIDLKLRGVPAGERNLVQFIGFILLLLATYREFLLHAWNHHLRKRQTSG